MYVKAIEGLWQDQGFVPVSDLHYEDSSVRRTTFESYAAGVVNRPGILGGSDS
jgi:hypothetical protein